MHTNIIVKQGAEEFTAKFAKNTHRAQRGKKGTKEKTLCPLRSSLRVLCGYAFLFLLLALCFTGCPTEAEDEGGTIIEVSLPIDGSGGRHYYDLSAGQEVSPNGDNWDIALEAHDGAFFVLTNSGDTAAALGMGASGSGGVWFTDTTDFDALVSKNQRVLDPGGDLGDTAAYTVDQKRYVMVMAADPVEQFLNVITYAGYPSGDGLSPGTRFEYNSPDMGNMAGFIPYRFNKRQAYRMTGMPPNYTPTKQVYIVRHGDGIGYSKVQLNEVYREAGSPSLFVLQLRHEAMEQ
jgi:hypothetical protein